MTITLRSDFDVELVEVMGSDEMICKAARVSTLGAASLESEESGGLINFLMRGRHGSPFEHGALMYRISQPIFSWREHMRHRIGHSYNEQSGRYMELDPVFYIPPTDRNLIQTGKPGEYVFVPGTEDQHEMTATMLETSYLVAWQTYQHLLQAGVAKEVARMCLPVSTYSTAYVTVNPRSLMAFLSLRTKEQAISMFPSFPQHEIATVASQMEKIFAEHFPLTHKAFDNNGRVNP